MSLHCSHWISLNKQAAVPLFKSEDIKEMVRHSICLDFGEVTDITKDIRITLYNSGHVLGASQIHMNIGNGLHNFVYTGDMKYAKTRLLDPAVNYFPRVETLLIESTYGSKNDILPPRQEAESKFIELEKERFFFQSLDSATHKKQCLKLKKQSG